MDSRDAFHRSRQGHRPADTNDTTDDRDPDPRPDDWSGESAPYGAALWHPATLIAFTEGRIRDERVDLHADPVGFLATRLAECRIGTPANVAVGLGYPVANRYHMALHACVPVARSVVAQLRPGGDRGLARRLLEREAAVVLAGDVGRVA